MYGCVRPIKFAFEFELGSIVKLALEFVSCGFILTYTCCWDFSLASAPVLSLVCFLVLFTFSLLSIWLVSLFISFFFFFLWRLIVLLYCLRIVFLLLCYMVLTLSIFLGFVMIDIPCLTLSASSLNTVWNIDNDYWIFPIKQHMEFTQLYPTALSEIFHFIKKLIWHRKLAYNVVNHSQIIT